MNWNFWPFIQSNSGLTPPYAQTPNTSGQWPFSPPWAKPTGGTAMVPFQERFPATMPSQGTSMVPVGNTPKLPAVRSANPLVKSGGGGLGAILDMLRPLAGGAAVQQGARSLLGGPLSTGLNAAAMVMQPTSMGAEPPLYVRDAQGNMVPNTANPIVQARMGSNGGGVTQAADLAAPLPQARPVPLPTQRPSMAGMNVPLPIPRPQMAGATNYYHGPGSMDFGSEGQLSGNTFGQGPGLLSLLFRK